MNLAFLSLAYSAGISLLNDFESIVNKQKPCLTSDAKTVLRINLTSKNKEMDGIFKVSQFAGKNESQGRFYHHLVSFSISSLSNCTI